MKKGLTVLCGGVLILGACVAVLAAEPARNIISITATTSSDNQIVSAYRGTERELNALIAKDNIGFRDDPKAKALAERLWSLQKQRVIAFLNERRPASEADLNLRSNVWAFLSPEPAAPTSTRLDDHTYLIYNLSGSGALVATQRSGSFKEVWSLDPTAANLICASGPTEPDSEGDLPGTSYGDHRFYLMTTPCAMSDMIETSGLTILRWHKGAVVPELSGTFDRSVEGIPIGSVHGRILEIATFGENKSFSGSGAKGGRPDLEWRISLRPKGVRDLGRSPWDRERYAVDTLFDRVRRGIRANNLAAPSVIARIRASIAGLHRPTLSYDVLLGDLEDWKVVRKGNIAKADFSVDPLPRHGIAATSRTYEFTLTYSKGVPYATRLKIFPDSPTQQDSLRPRFQQCSLRYCREEGNTSCPRGYDVLDEKGEPVSEQSSDPVGGDLKSIPSEYARLRCH